MTGKKQQGKRKEKRRRGKGEEVGSKLLLRKVLREEGIKKENPK